MKTFISVLMSLFATAAVASEPIRVPGVWGFAVGSTQGLYFRAIMEQANQQQKKYEFQFEHRPGAGGAIAAKHVLDSKSLTIMAAPLAFFVRPNLYPETPYRFDQFKPLLMMGQAPAVLMTKGKTLDQLLQQPRIILGTAGAGSGTHLAAETLKKYLKDKEVVMVHFKDTNEAYVNVLGGHIDGAFEFLGDAKAKASGDVVFAGLTGRERIDGIQPLRDRGFADMEFVSGIFAIYVPTTMPESQVKEIREILLRAERHESVQALYRKDYTYRDPAHQNLNQLESWYRSSVERFKSLTQNVKVN